MLDLRNPMANINRHEYPFLSITEGQMRILQNVSLRRLYTSENFKPQNMFKKSLTALSNLSYIS